MGQSGRLEPVSYHRIEWEALDAVHRSSGITQTDGPSQSTCRPLPLSTERPQKLEPAIVSREPATQQERSLTFKMKSILYVGGG